MPTNSKYYCDCGGDYKSTDNRLDREYAKKNVARGGYLECEECEDRPTEKVFKVAELAELGRIYSKSDYAKKLGIKPPSLTVMVNSGRVKVVSFHGKELIYDEEKLPTEP